MPRLPGTPPGWKPNRRFRHVHAIVRVDSFLPSDSPIEDQVTVVRVLTDPTLARREVDRLNTVNGHKGVRYFLQTTRLDVRSVPAEQTHSDE